MLYSCYTGCDFCITVGLIFKLCFMSKLIGIRFPDDLVDKIETRRGDSSVSSFVIQCITDYLAGGSAEVGSSVISIPEPIIPSDSKVSHSLVIERINDLESKVLGAIDGIGQKIEGSRWTNGSEKGESRVLEPLQRLVRRDVVTKPKFVALDPDLVEKAFDSETDTPVGGLREAVEKWYAKKIGKPSYEDWNAQGLAAIDREYGVALALGKSPSDYFVEEEPERVIKPVDLDALRKSMEELDNFSEGANLVRASDLKPISKDDQLKWVGKKK